jgi:LPPG:FO 2-phospho-L-lactate transferase
MNKAPHVVLLAGGGGGARMAEGLANTLRQGTLTVIGNIADDETFYGLHISPDIDTLLYTLSGHINRIQGWGIANDTIHAQSMLKNLGEPVWMKLGDADLGMHIWRSVQLKKNKSLTAITGMASRVLKARACVLPPTNETVTTKITTEKGQMRFQEWFVKNHCEPKVLAIHYHGCHKAKATQKALNALHKADLIVIAPSNPWLSIEPILAIKTLRNSLIKRNAPCIAVSPLVGNKALKGPLVKLMVDLGLPVSLQTIAKQYQGLIDAMVIDHSDQKEKDRLNLIGLPITVADIIMSTPLKATQLAQTLIETFAHKNKPQLTR